MQIVFRGGDEVESFLGVFKKVKKSFEVKVEWRKFSLRSQQLGSVSFKIFSRI